MKIKEKILLRIYFVFLLMFVSGAAVLWKVYQIQNYKEDFWLKKSAENNSRLFTITGERGNIFSHDGNLLATSYPFFDLFVDFGSKAMTPEIFNANVDSLAIYMAKYFGKKDVNMYRKELISARDKKYRYYRFKRKVDYATLKFIQTWPLFKEGKYAGGLIAETRQSRQTPFGQLAKRTIGEHRDEYPVGLEASYNEYLSGEKSEILKHRITGNIWMPITDKRVVEPQDGHDITTTININFQDIAENALMKALDSSKAEFGCAVVMEVKTGAIRAIANLGLAQNGSYMEINNYAVSHISEPGSTFKAVSYLMLLDKKAIRLNDTIMTNSGRWNFYGSVMRDDHLHENYLSVKEAFARSSNIAIARLIDRHYSTRKNEFYQNLDKYGLTKPSGIDILGENKPQITKPEKWSKLSLPWRATGYEQEFNVIQLLTFYNTIANDGYRATPYLVEKISRNGQTVKEFQPKISKKPIAGQQAIHDLKELLKAVVEHPRGTAKGIKSDLFELAGKTGTAKILDEKTKTFTRDNQAMFAGYFPADEPKYSCIVLIYKPKGAYRTGGSVAAPVFKEVAEKILATEMQVAPVYQTDSPNQFIAQIKGESKEVSSILSKHGYQTNLADDMQYVSADIKTSGLKLQTIKNTGLEVPNLQGMNLDDVLFILENMGLKVEYKGVGKVVNQSIAPGSKIESGQQIFITLKIKA